jgi:hypothetical protein
VSFILLLLLLLLLQVCVASVAVPALGTGQREADVAAHEDRQVSVQAAMHCHIAQCYYVTCYNGFRDRLMWQRKIAK